MICPKCSRDIDDNENECPFCGIVIAKYRAEERSASVHFPSGTEEEKKQINIPYVKIGLVAVGIILLWFIFKPKYASDLTVISYKSNEATSLSCSAAEKCVIAYLAPW